MVRLLVIKHHGHNQYVHNTWIELERSGPVAAGNTQIAVAEQQSAEGDGVRDDEQPLVSFRDGMA